MEKLLTVEEVAEMIGFTRAGVYALIVKRRIPCIKISRRCVRFRQSDLEAWLRNKTLGITRPDEPHQLEPKRGRGRPRKNGGNLNVDRIVDQAKREVQGNVG
jgi:excisionase family DNA binding protein